MNVKQTPLNGLLRLSLDVYEDDRGCFSETWQSNRYAEAGIRENFAQDNVSYSNPGVLRGLHFRAPEPQAQLVTVLSGTIFDVCVDIRKDSETIGQWYGEELSGKRLDQMYMPPGFAHGFCVLGHESAIVHYKCTQTYDARQEKGLNWADPDIAVDWPDQDWVVSEKDQALPFWSEYVNSDFKT